MPQHHHTYPQTGRVRSRARGFSLTELLVVIGIIVALAAVGLPVALRAYRNVNKARTQADLQAISTALNAYKQDFGDYPRIEKAPGISPALGWNIGAAVLCKALIGPYGDGVTSTGATDPDDPPTSASLGDIKSGHCVAEGNRSIALVDDAGTNYGDMTKWAPFNPRDGADGPGFRLRGVDTTGDGVPDKFQGKVWGPYLQADKFNVVGCMMHDREGNPILYFPARSGGSTIRLQTGGFGGYVDRSEQSLYDARDGLVFFRRDTETDDTNALKAIRVMLGDFTNNNTTLTANGKIDQSETPATEAGFLLWTAGPDELFGPIRPDSGTWDPSKRDIDRCDDITNFTR